MVKGLSADIGPDLGTNNAQAALFFNYGSGADLTSLTLQYDEGSFKIDVNQVQTGSSSFTQSYGILFDSTSKNGGNGDFETTGSGQRGHHGDDGRDLNLTLGSSTTIVGGADFLAGSMP